ncbi:hypothetical protein PR048_010348 [Dryococelus australis]|uniref:Uncharacterized protein n=1 Tax=Dryococelus australis TaxID=614101 RepID=A0ABQ9I2H8_9NEOP|nr:hypothetical protein PR048_010348 [Dryococelus australis]
MEFNRKASEAKVTNIRTEQNIQKENVGITSQLTELLSVVLRVNFQYGFYTPIHLADRSEFLTPVRNNRFGLTPSTPPTLQQLYTLRELRNGFQELSVPAFQLALCVALIPVTSLRLMYVYHASTVLRAENPFVAGTWELVTAQLACTRFVLWKNGKPAKCCVAMDQQPRRSFHHVVGGQIRKLHFTNEKPDSQRSFSCITDTQCDENTARQFRALRLVVIGHLMCVAVSSSSFPRFSALKAGKSCRYGSTFLSIVTNSTGRMPLSAPDKIYAAPGEPHSLEDLAPPPPSFNIIQRSPDDPAYDVNWKLIISSSATADIVSNLLPSSRNRLSIDNRTKPRQTLARPVKWERGAEQRTMASAVCRERRIQCEDCHKFKMALDNESSCAPSPFPPLFTTGPECIFVQIKGCLLSYPPHLGQQIVDSSKALTCLQNYTLPSNFNWPCLAAYLVPICSPRLYFRLVIDPSRRLFVVFSRLEAGLLVLLVSKKNCTSIQSSLRSGPTVHAPIRAAAVVDLFGDPVGHPPLACLCDIFCGSVVQSRNHQSRAYRSPTGATTMELAWDYGQPPLALTCLRGIALSLPDLGSGLLRSLSASLLAFIMNYGAEKNKEGTEPDAPSVSGGLIALPYSLFRMLYGNGYSRLQQIKSHPLPPKQQQKVDLFLDDLFLFDTENLCDSGSASSFSQPTFETVREICLGSQKIISFPIPSRSGVFADLTFELLATAFVGRWTAARISLNLLTETVEEFSARGSGWSLQQMTYMDVHVSQHRTFTIGAVHTKLPKFNANCLTCVDDIRKFEENNSIAINVYCVVDKDSNIIDETCENAQFDTSNCMLDNPQGFSCENKHGTGVMKDEYAGRIIRHFVPNFTHTLLRMSNVYDYRDCLKNYTRVLGTQYQFHSRAHEVYNEWVTKVVLSGIDTLRKSLRPSLTCNTVWRQRRGLGKGSGVCQKYLSGDSYNSSYRHTAATRMLPADLSLYSSIDFSFSVACQPALETDVSSRAPDTQHISLRKSYTDVIPTATSRSNERILKSFKVFNRKHFERLRNCFSTRHARTWRVDAELLISPNHVLARGNLTATPSPISPSQTTSCFRAAMNEWLSRHDLDDSESKAERRVTKGTRTPCNLACVKTGEKNQRASDWASSENGAEPELWGGLNERSPRKPADQRYRPARFPLGNIRDKRLTERKLFVLHFKPRRIRGNQPRSLVEPKNFISETVFCAVVRMPFCGRPRPATIAYVIFIPRSRFAAALLNAVVVSFVFDVNTRQKAKSKYTYRIRLERASQKQSNDTHKTPCDQVKRCRERKKYIKASECPRRIHAKQMALSPTHLRTSWIRLRARDDAVPGICIAISTRGVLLAANPSEVLVLRPPPLFRPAEDEFAEDRQQKCAVRGERESCSWVLHQ